MNRLIRSWAVVACGVAVATIFPPGATAVAADAVIEGLDVRPREGGLSVSYSVTGALSDDLLDRIHSGIELTFRHRVELLGKRVVPLFPRKTLGRTLVITTVKYDALTRRYRMERRVTGKDWPQDLEPPDRVDHRSSTRVEDVIAWMTEVNDVPLPGKAALKATKAKLRVRSELGRRFVLLLFPATRAATEERSLDF